MKRLLVILLKMGVGGGMLAYLIYSGRLNFSRLLLFRDAPGVLALMMGVLALVIVPLTALRWWLLLRAIGLHVALYRTLALTWIGLFFSTTLPGAVTGDVVKGYYVLKAQRGEDRTRAVMTLLLDRCVGLFGLIVMAFVALVCNLELLLSQPRMHALAWMITAMFAGIVLCSGVALYPFPAGRDPFLRLCARLPASGVTMQLYRTVKSYQHQKPTLLVALLLSIAMHSLIALLFFQLTRLLGIRDMALATQFFIMPIGLLTMALPLAPAGIGIGHVAFASLYQLAGFSGGADIFNLFVIVQLALSLLGGIPYFFYSGAYGRPEQP